MSAAIGAMFGLFLGPVVRGRQRAGLAAGSAYGAAWWVLGPLTLMPWIMGMGLAANWTAAGIGGALPSLVGHLVFAAVLGLVYHRVASSDRTRPIRASSAA